MDAQRILGVPPAAGRTEIGAAYRRLSSRVSPAAGGTRALAALVSSAHRAALDGGRLAATAEIDPYAVLGVTPTTPADDVRTAFRRIAQLVHPDRGGTDELFRIVDTAHDLVTNPLARFEQKTRIRYRPPPPPPPPGPFRPRPVDMRRYQPAWRSWLTIGWNVGLIATGIALAGTTLVVAVGLRTSLRLFPLMGLLCVFGFAAARPAFVAIRRAAAQLRARRVVAAALDVDEFLIERCLDAPVGREREDVLYLTYRQWCENKRRQPVSSFAFLEYLRTLGVLYVNASSWDTGVLVGIRLRDD